MAMRHMHKFPRAVEGTTAFMGAVYLLFGCVGYWRLGSDFDVTKPVTSILDQDAWVMAANAGLLVHCVIAYMVRSCSLVCFVPFALWPLMLHFADTWDALSDLPSCQLAMHDWGKSRGGTAGKQSHWHAVLRLALLDGLFHHTSQFALRMFLILLFQIDAMACRLVSN
jgi:hypothetical protein